MATKLKTKSITLSGSTKIITDFFQYSLNSLVPPRSYLINIDSFHARILYQRGIYPPNDFTLVKKYGLTLFTSNDQLLQDYIKTILAQLNHWLSTGKLSRLVMAIITTESRTTIERWQFDINLDSHHDTPSSVLPTSTPSTATPTSTRSTKNQEKSLAQIQKDIQDIIRQITSSVTFLPAIQEKCLFNILVYTDMDTEIPLQWTEADPLLIQGRAEQVRHLSPPTLRDVTWRTDKRYDRSN